LTRIGAEVEASYDPGDGTFRPLLTAGLGHGRVTGLRLWCQADGGGSAVATVRSFEVEADELARPGPPAPGAGLTRGARGRFEAAVAVNSALAAAIILGRLAARLVQGGAGRGNGRRE
jgi:hypothetical protein